MNRPRRAVAQETLLYGRAEEEATLERMLADALEGRSRSMIVRGLPGVGKTALLGQAAEQARGKGMRVLRCTGVESELEVVFAGLHQVVRPIAGGIDRLQPPQAQALRGALGLEASAGDRYLVATGLLTLLADAADEQPLLVLVDDAHWLDTPSAEALMFAARRLEAEPIAALFADREGPERESGTAGLPVLDLHGLEPGAAAELLDAQGRDLAPEVRARLLAESDGNPLALIELSSSLSRGELEGTEPLPGRLPLSSRLRQSYLDRVRRLPEETQRLLLLAAAEDDLAVVLAAGARPQVDEKALGPAEREGLVRVDERRVRFRHPLLRSAIYQGAAFHDRSEAHRLLARALAGNEHDDRRAWHLAAATIGHDEQVAAALERAADRAEQGSGPEAASTALERAAWLTPDQAQRIRRLLRAAWGAFNAGQWARAHRLLDQAAALTADAQILADIAFIRGLLQFQSANIDTAYTTLVGGAELVREPDPDLAATILAAAGRMAWLAADLPRLEEIKSRVMALPGPPGSLSKRLARTVLGHLLAAEDRPPEGFVAVAFESLDSEDASASALGPWLWPMVSMALEVGEETALHRLYSQSVARFRAAGFVSQLTQALTSLTQCEIYLGYWKTAEVHAAEALRLIGDTGQTRLAGVLLPLQTIMAGGQGRAEDCRRLAEEARVAARGADVRLPGAEWGLGLLELGARSYEDAYTHLSAIARPERWPAGNLFAPITVFDLLEAAILTDREDIARRVLDALERWAEPYSPSWATLAIHRARAMLATGAEAEAEFQAALAVASTRRFEVARTRLAYGEWLRRRRRRAEARNQLRAALEAFDEMGATPWTERAQAELRANGEAIPGRGLEPVEQLTPQELQIARLAARGLSNREIGAQLFLSPRTVGFHLYKLFPKLGIASRAALRRLRLEADLAS